MHQAAVRHVPFDDHSKLITELTIRPSLPVPSQQCATISLQRRKGLRL
jgi:hypothetical protein